MMKSKDSVLQSEVSLYSVVTFKEHGFTGNEVKGVVTSINGDEIIVEDFNGQVWTMNVNMLLYLVSLVEIKWNEN